VGFVFYKAFTANFTKQTAGGLSAVKSNKITAIEKERAAQKSGPFFSY
jgi:hypothetical protein